MGMLRWMSTSEMRILLRWISGSKLRETERKNMSVFAITP